MHEKLLEIKNLHVSFKTPDGYFNAVSGVNLDIHKNEVFALVGESGSGKSAIALSIINLHNPNYTCIRGKILYAGQDLLSLDEMALNKIRGSHIGMIFQDSLLALNPMMRVGAQIEEALFYHSSMNKAERKAETLRLLEEVGIASRAYTQLPHALSGGMRQRAMIAIAIACKPELIIADEPTTALDVTIQATILELLHTLQNETKASILLITHDLGVVAEMADRVGVMTNGKIVEVANVYDVFERPRHAYTKSLLGAML